VVVVIHIVQLCVYCLYSFTTTWWWPHKRQKHVG